MWILDIFFLAGKGITIFYEDAQIEFFIIFIECFFKNDVIKCIIKVNFCIIL